MGLDMYFHGEKELSPKSYKERKLIRDLNQLSFSAADWNQLKQIEDKDDYLYCSEWSNPGLNELLNKQTITGQIGHIKGLKCRVDKMGINHWTIITESWYLRKANAIHKWMVKHAQDGVDDCGYYPIDHVLQSFVDDSSKVLDGSGNATDIMPTQSGFFFGGTEYDEWYYRELRQTRQRFKRMMAKFRKDKWKYFYHSSW